MQTITKAAHEAGAMVGFDLAHAAGNVPMQLHEWNVDFAVWCTYKYLNSGPGGPGGVFVHQRHGNNPQLPRFAGWWGYDEATRFQMKPGFIPQQGAAGWQLSNAQVLAMAAHKASLDIFLQTNMQQLRKKSILLTGYLEFLLNEKIEKQQLPLKIITPADPAERGCQLSLLVKENGKQIFQKLTEANIVVDWREPDVIRIAPVPLYNTFEDVWRMVNAL
jgi:kynureninase